MSDEKVLTRKIAEQLLADKKHLDTVVVLGREFTTIEDEAAESLSKHEGYLHLRGLTSLSDVAAKSLSKYQHVGIRLIKLPASAAKILRDAWRLRW
ncbi:MAG: hypothetical protein VB817_06565 [Pirellulaceae bacterium]